MAVIFTHSDGDGLCAASLLKMVRCYHNSSVIFTHPMGIADDLADVDDDLVICDIAMDKRAFPRVKEILTRIAAQHQILYLDHHPLPGPLPPQVITVRDESVCATELVFRYFYSDLPETADRIALIGAINDYLDTTPLMKELLHNFERRTLYLDAGILAQGLKNLQKNYDAMRDLVFQFASGAYPCNLPHLVAEAIRTTQEDKTARLKVIQMYRVKTTLAWVENPPASKSKAAHWIMGHARKLIGITINTYRNRYKNADITIRGRRLVNLQQVIPPIAEAVGGTGGGLYNAVGCRIPLDAVPEFLGLLDDTLQQLQIPHPTPIEQLIRLPPPV